MSKSNEASDVVREKSRIYYAKNKEKRIQSSMKWQLANKEKCKANRLKWEAANKDRRNGIRRDCYLKRKLQNTIILDSLCGFHPNDVKKILLAHENLQKESCCSVPDSNEKNERKV